MPPVAIIVRRMWRALPGPVRSLARILPGTKRLGTAVQRGVETTADHQAIYDEAYYRSRAAEADASAAVIARSLVERFAPAHVLDVGCGTGDVLAHLREAGVRGTGLELSEAALKVCHERGLEVVAFDLEHDDPEGVPRVDVVVSTEVAEHLPESCADRFVDLLSGRGDVVVFTAATPGQGGTDHVNEQPHAYWLDKFAERGFALDDAVTQHFRTTWHDGGTEPWYHENVMVVRRRGQSGERRAGS